MRRRAPPAGPGALPAAVLLAAALLAAGPALAQTLGQIPADYEVHGELVLVSGQLEGFFEACGFGRKPDRDELMRWYEHHHLARSMGRIQGIYDLGVALGREGPCTADHHVALVRQWQSLLTRTLAYVDTYRR